MINHIVIEKYIIYFTNNYSIKYNQNFIGIVQQKDLFVNKLIKLEFFRNTKKYKFSEIKRKIIISYDEIILFALNKNSYTLHTNIFVIIHNIYNNYNFLNVNKIKKEKKYGIVCISKIF